LSHFLRMAPGVDWSSPASFRGWTALPLSTESSLWLFSPRPAWTKVLLFYASCCIWDDRRVPWCLAFSVKMGSHERFLPKLPGTLILSISASQVLGLQVCSTAPGSASILRESHSFPFFPFVSIVNYVDCFTNIKPTFIPGMNPIRSNCFLLMYHWVGFAKT
jgi:hypothetical protein